MIDDHQRERMRAWALFCASMMPRPAPHPERDADSMLAEFDKRFPAPSAAAPVEPVTPSAFAYDVKVIDVETYKADMAELETLRRTQAMHDAELASLRQKARLWDAVASGKVRLDFYVYGPPEFEAAYGEGCFTPRFPTAEEAVESAIAQGALK